MTRLALALSIAVLAGCTKAPRPKPTLVDAAVAANNTSPPDAAIVDASAADASVPLDPLALVLDGKADALPERATEPTRPFDWVLRDRVAPTKRSSSPSPLRQGRVTVDHGLPPEVVTRIARQQFGRVRLCYEAAARKSPKLAGSLELSFTVSPDGSVKDVARAAGLDDKDLVGCVVRAFGSLAMPMPEGGESHVVYGLAFAPPEE